MNSSERIADAGALSSIFIWLTSHALEWMPILQAASLMVAIVAGVDPDSSAWMPLTVGN